MVEIGIYIFKTADTDYLDLGAYGWLFNENTAQSVIYINEIQKASLC